MHTRRTGSAHRRRWLLTTIAVLTLVAAGPVAAWAGDWQDGDVFVGVFGSAAYRVYGNGGALRESISQGTSGSPAGCAFDRNGVLHTINSTNGLIVRFLGAHPHNRLPNILTGGSGAPQAVSFDRAGSFYVGNLFTPDSLLKFDAAGVPTGAFTPAAPPTGIDLSADQRTMFFTSGAGVSTRIHRFDVVSGINLPVFADLGGTNPVGDLRLLPPGDGSGGLIVGHDADIKRLNGTGAVVRTYDVPGEDGWSGISLDPDGASFWAVAVDPGNVYRFNLATGAVDRGPLASDDGALRLCVRGTRTAALDNARPSIHIATPANGATFQQGQLVIADYACTDDVNGTGIESCAGPVGSGAAIDTSSVGPRTFTVNGTDRAGNTATLTSSYAVVAAPPPPGGGGGGGGGGSVRRAARIRITVSFLYAAGPRSTVFSRLRVRGIPRGSTLRVRCVGKRCPRRSFRKRDARGTVSLTPYLGKRLRVATRLEITVTKPGMIGVFKSFKIRKSKGPSIATRCVPPGGRPQRRC